MQDVPPPALPTLDLGSFTAEPHTLLARLRESGEAVSLSADGSPAAVVLSVQAYNKLLDELEHAELMAEVAQSQRDCAEGKCQPLDEAFADIREILLAKLTEGKVKHELSG